MSIFSGTNQIKKVFVGTQEIKKIYLGTQKVFESTPPPEPIVYDFIADGIWNSEIKTYNNLSSLGYTLLTLTFTCIYVAGGTITTIAYVDGLDYFIFSGQHNINVTNMVRSFGVSSANKIEFDSYVSHSNSTELKKMYYKFNATIT